MGQLDSTCTTAPPVLAASTDITRRSGRGTEAEAFASAAGAGAGAGAAQTPPGATPSNVAFLAAAVA
jgi:hypothetical protein